jgi:hypothetical protein
VGNAAHETEDHAMTDTPPKRRFWQIHLSTILLMSLSAGFIGWINFKDRHSGYGGWPARCLWWRTSEFIPYQIDTDIFVQDMMTWALLLLMALLLGEWLAAKLDTRR